MTPIDSLSSFIAEYQDLTLATICNTNYMNAVTVARTAKDIKDVQDTKILCCVTEIGFGSAWTDIQIGRAHV